MPAGLYGHTITEEEEAKRIGINERLMMMPAGIVNPTTGAANLGSVHN
jgi:hypothetical protein